MNSLPTLLLVKLSLNVGDIELGTDHHNIQRFTQDASIFAQIPITNWARCHKEFKTIGKEYEEAMRWASPSGTHDVAERLANHSNPGMAYLNASCEGNPDMLHIVTAELPSDVFAECGQGGGRGGRKVRKSSKGSNSSASKPSGKGVGREFLPRLLTEAMTKSKNAQAAASRTQNFGLAHRTSTPRQKGNRTLATTHLLSIVLRHRISLGKKPICI